MSLNQQISNNIEDILDEFGIDYSISGSQIRFPCPVHNGKGKNACIYIGENYEPNWKCYSYNCHNNQSSLVSLCMKLLNVDYKGLLAWLEKFNIKDEPINPNKKFIKSTNLLTAKRKVITEIVSHIPKTKDANYYIKRGISKDVLNKFKVGLCNDRNSYFYGYIIVPVFHDDGKNIAGIIARNPYDKCLICQGYHNENSVCSPESTKWKNSKGFYNNSFFYNLWNAKAKIKETNKAILVEGPADVWKLYEAGIQNVLGIFGTSLSTDQKIILESLPITKITIFLDPDEPGRNASEILKQYLSRFYSVETINAEKQPSNCSIDELRKLFNGNRVYS